MKNINEFLYGSVLKVTRNDTIETIEKNFKDMKAAGQDTVVIWPGFFWWEEKGENYPFDTGIKILDAAEKIGIKVIMELAGQLTSCEYIPDFMMKEEYFARDKWGAIEAGQPSFGFLSYFHPEVNDLICKHFSDAAKAYCGKSALIGYDIFNETMFRSFDEYTLGEFRNWLREKYGTIEKLNDVWERTYSDWSQIRFETWMWMSVMPRADHAAFKKASITRFMKNWAEAVRSVDSEHFLIVDNIHSMVSRAGSYDRPQDDFALLDVADEIGMSFYPKQVGGCMDPAERWQIFDGFYAASKRKGFLISEMQTHTQAMFNPTTAVRPYELKQWCMEAAAAGAKGIVYWMWRQFDKGLQTLGRGLVDYKGRPTERLTAATEIRETLCHGIMKPIKSKVGLVYDPLCEDFQRTYTDAYQVENDIYLTSLHGTYKAFVDNNVRCDVITLDEIENYPFILLTNHIALSETNAIRIKEYVKNGGKILTSGRLAAVDEFSLACADQPGFGLSDLLGYEWLDTDYEGLTARLSNGKTLEGYYTHEITNTTGTAEGTFENGDVAVVYNRYGEGETIAVNSDVFHGYAKTGDTSVKDFVSDIADRFNLRQIKVEGDLTIRISETEKGLFLFCFNYSKEEKTAHITEVLGKAVDITVTAAPQQVVLEEVK